MSNRPQKLSAELLPFSVTVGFAYRDRGGSEHLIGTAQTFHAKSEHQARHYYNVAARALVHDGAACVGGEMNARLDGITIDTSKPSYIENRRNMGRPGPKAEPMPSPERILAEIFDGIFNQSQPKRSVPVNPFMLGTGVNKQLEVQGRFWMVTECNAVEANRPHPAGVVDKARIGGKGPTICHSTRMSAEAECERLAQQHPGTRFVVLEAVSESQSRAVREERTVNKVVSKTL